MKKSIILIALVLASVAYATVTTSFNITDAYATKMLAAFLAQDGCSVQIQIRGEPDPEDPNVAPYVANIDFELVAKDPNEGQAAYGKRRISKIISAFVQAHQRKLLVDARRTYINGAPSTAVDPPDAVEE